MLYQVIQTNKFSVLDSLFTHNVLACILYGCITVYSCSSLILPFEFSSCVCYLQASDFTVNPVQLLHMLEVSVYGGRIKFSNEIIENESLVTIEKLGCSWGSVRGTLSPSSSSRPRPSDRKGKITKRVHSDRNLIREGAGFAPYEKRVTELLKVGKDKRALKVAKKKLGTHKGAKKRCEEMSGVLRKMRCAGTAEK